MNSNKPNNTTPKVNSNTKVNSNVNNGNRFNANAYKTPTNNGNKTNGNKTNGNIIKTNTSTNTGNNMKVNNTSTSTKGYFSKYSNETILKYVLFGILIILLLTGIGFGIYYLVRYIQKRKQLNEIQAENDTKALVSAENISKEKEVYHVAENRFSYKNAEAECKALGSELATPEQLVEAYKKGANWCSYGWTKGGHAYYPIQQDFYKRIQDDESCGLKGQCGVPGINGGYFDPSLKFGVNCYGEKRAATKVEEEATKKKCSGDVDLDNKVRQYKQELSDVMFAPFAPGKWSIA